MLTRPLGRPKNRWEDDIINEMKKMKIKNWTRSIAICGKYMLRRPKRSNNEVVAPKKTRRRGQELASFTNFVAAICAISVL